MSNKKILFTYDDNAFGVEVEILDFTKKDGTYRVILAGDPTNPGERRYKYMTADTFKEAIETAQKVADIIYDHPEMRRVVS